MNTDAAAVLSAVQVKENKAVSAHEKGHSRRNNTYFFLRILFTVSGFFIAILVNLFFPQTADVEIKDYRLNIFGMNVGLTSSCFQR